MEIDHAELIRRYLDLPKDNQKVLAPVVEKLLGLAESQPTFHLEYELKQLDLVEKISTIKERLRPRQTILKVQGLTTSFKTELGRVHAIEDVSFDVFEDEVLAIVGESGSGKSVTSLSILRLIPNPPGEITRGQLWFQGRDLLKLPMEEMKKIRGKEISMIFQEPMTSLNPVFTIGWQIKEMIRHHEACNEAESTERAIKMLELVGIPEPAKRLNNYPHQFSGGMRQRVMIAMMLACNPALLIADEPTTALDVTIQAQILELMIDLKRKRQGSAIILITHDLAVVAETCQRVIVMYGGRIQEISSVTELFENPRHPYTRGLLRSLPHPNEKEKQKRLQAIPGMVPNIHHFPQGCKFCTRCELKEERCEREEPPLVEILPGHSVRCHLATPEGTPYVKE
jgi:oligopeptide/dipeptide ABC transporter ATP-binding protein